MNNNAKLWLSVGEFEALSTLNPGKFDAVEELINIGSSAKEALFWTAMTMQGTGFESEWESVTEVTIDDGFDYNALTVMRDVMENSGSSLVRDASIWSNIPECMYMVTHHDSSDITIDITESGAGGLDTGTEAISTMYYIYAIGKADAPGIISGVLSAESAYYDVTLPAGYDQIAPVGCVYNDASGNLVAFESDVLKGGVKRFAYTAKQTALTGGVSASYAGVPIDVFIPDDWSINGVWVNLNVTGTAVFSLSLDGISGVMAISASQQMVYIPFDVLEYKRDSGSGSLDVEVVAFDYSPFGKF